MARTNARNICQADFRAWDMARYVMLCQSGARVGFISEREVVDFAMLAALQVQNHYRSWREMAEQVMLVAGTGCPRCALYL